MLRRVLAALIIALATGAKAIADDASPSPPPADVNADESLVAPARSLTIQTTYTGATYGPTNFRTSQVIPRIAAIYLGRSLLRITIPRVQAVNGIDSGYGDMQVFYLWAPRLQGGRNYAGFFTQLPTHSPQSFGSPRWLIGPAFARILAWKPGIRTLGLLLQSGFSVVGPRSAHNESTVTFLPFGSWALKNGWFVKTAESPWVFDLARGSTIIALGGGFGHTASICGVQTLISVTDEVTVVHANVRVAPKNTWRFAFTFLSPARR